MRTFMSDLTDLDGLEVSVVQGSLIRLKEVPSGVELMSRAFVSDASLTQASISKLPRHPDMANNHRIVGDKL